MPLDEVPCPCCEKPTTQAYLDENFGLCEDCDAAFSYDPDDYRDFEHDEC